MVDIFLTVDHWAVHLRELDRDYGFLRWPSNVFTLSVLISLWGNMTLAERAGLRIMYSPADHLTTIHMACTIFVSKCMTHFVYLIHTKLHEVGYYFLYFVDEDNGPRGT